MRKICIATILVLSVILTFPSFSAFADTSASDAQRSAVRYADGSYIVISEIRIVENSETKGSASTKTAEIDAAYYDSNDNLEWKYTLRASFTYTYGVSSSCTSATYTQDIIKGNWSFSDGSASRSANIATGVGVYKQKVLFIVVQTVNVNLHLECDKYGVIS